MREYNHVICGGMDRHSVFRVYFPSDYDEGEAKIRSWGSYVCGDRCADCYAKGGSGGSLGQCDFKEVPATNHGDQAGSMSIRG